MRETSRKFEAVQMAVKNYFERFPRVSIKALSLKTSVPYATLRRIIQAEVNDIKDETIFKLIDRVMQREDRMSFIRDYYPSLAKVVIDQPEQLDADGVMTALKRFRYMDPHNFIIKLSLTKAGMTRADIQRLTGSYGMGALDEMLHGGLLMEDGDTIRFAGKNFGMDDVDDIQQQIRKDLNYFPRNLVGTQYARIGHISESITLEALARIVAMSGDLMKEVEVAKDRGTGSTPFFFDILIGTYDRDTLGEDEK